MITSDLIKSSIKKLISTRRILLNHNIISNSNNNIIRNQYSIATEKTFFLSSKQSKKLLHNNKYTYILPSTITSSATTINTIMSSSSKTPANTPTDTNEKSNTNNDKNTNENERTKESKDKIEVPADCNHITEGSSHMLLPLVEPKNSNKSNQSVFYNPVQIQNRDLSILMISMYQKIHAPDKKLKILDALAASGLRSIRYIKEIPHVDHITINDMDEAAIKLANQNIKMNNLTKEQTNKIKTNHGDAISYMYSNKNTYNVIDLDPYGSASQFLNAAVYSIADNGLLCITCTDMVVLAGGGNVDKCYARYGCTNIPKAKYCQEYALRIVLHALNTHATTYGKVITPLLSVGMAFYVRLFVKVNINKGGVLKSCTKIGMVYQSTQCPSYYTIPLTTLNAKGTCSVPSRGPPTPTCESTNAPFKIAGPIWLNPIHDTTFINQVLKELDKNHNEQSCFIKYISTKKQIYGLLSLCHQELPNIPLYYTIPDLTNTLHCVAPPKYKIYNAIKNAGYDVSISQHKEPTAIKTNASPGVIWSVMRAWCKLHPVNKKWYTGKHENSACAKILLAHDDDGDDNKELIKDVNWSDARDENEKNRSKDNNKKSVRYPMNPEKYWGPKPRAIGQSCHKQQLEQKKQSNTTTATLDNNDKQEKLKDDTGADVTKKRAIDEKEDKPQTEVKKSKI